MDRRERSVAPISMIRRAAYPGVVTLVLALFPCLVSADEPWTGGPRLGLPASAAGSTAGQSVVTALSPGSVLLAQAGASATDAAPGGWQLTIAPYLWAPRTGDRPDPRPPFQVHDGRIFRRWRRQPRPRLLGPLRGDVAGVDRSAGPPVSQGREGRDNRGRDPDGSRLRAAVLRVRRDISVRHSPGRAHGADHARGAGRGPADVR